MKHPILTTLLVLIAALSSAACRGAGAGPRSTDRILAEAQELNVARAHAPRAGVLTAGQITPEQMSALAARGYGTFINLRGTGEKGTGWEAEHARALDVRYVSIPVTGAGDVTEANARLLDSELAAAPGPVVVYCASGNRVGALLALRARYVEGQTPEEALALGRAAGLTRLEPVVREKLGL